MMKNPSTFFCPPQGGAAMVTAAVPQLRACCLGALANLLEANVVFGFPVLLHLLRREVSVHSGAMRSRPLQYSCCPAITITRSLVYLVFQKRTWHTAWDILADR